MSQTKIEWCDTVWNPVTGCTPISEGCQNCYAARFAKRLAGRFGYPADDPFRVTLHPERLNEPLRWKIPRRAFVCSMGDLFHDDVPEDFINKVFTVMLATKEHTYILLTKRPQRAYKYLTNPKTPHLIVESLDVDLMDRIAERYEEHQPFGEFPLNNVWLGVAAENQQRADERIPVLLQTPASVHFISVEPMLGPINVFPYLEPKNIRKQHKDGSISLKLRPSVKWVIAGGETGPNARPVHPDWVRSLRNQCQTAGVPFFFKQWGEYIPPYDAGYRSKETDSYGKTFGYRWVHSSVEVDGLHMVKVGRKAAGRLLDGQEWNEMPEGVTPCPKATVRNTNII